MLRAAKGPISQTLGKERTAQMYALIVLAEMSAHYYRFIHRNTEIISNEINSCQNGEVGVALATSWATHLGNLA